MPSLLIEKFKCIVSPGSINESTIRRLNDYHTLACFALMESVRFEPSSGSATQIVSGSLCRQHSLQAFLMRGESSAIRSLVCHFALLKQSPSAIYFIIRVRCFPHFSANIYLPLFGPAYYFETMNVVMAHLLMPSTVMLQVQYLISYLFNSINVIGGEIISYIVL